MANEVWADPISFNRERSLLSVIFSTTPSAARNPVCLSRWNWHVTSLARGKIAPQNAVDATIHRWIMAQVSPGQVTQLTWQAEAGLDLFGVDLPVDPRLAASDYSPYDHNGAMVWLDLRPGAPVVLGVVGAHTVALERLKVLYAQGARPVLGARVQANRALYEPGTRSGHPALAIFTFDPAVQPAYLEEVSLFLYDLKLEDSENPVLLAAAQAMLLNEEEWRYDRRLRIPAELTRGHVIYAGDIWIHRAFLANGLLTPQPRALPLLAELGDAGGLELIPFDRISNFWPEPQASIFGPRPG